MTSPAPYTPDQQRVADWLWQRTNGSVGAGEDPIGFLLASYEMIHAQLDELKDQLSVQHRKEQLWNECKGFVELNQIHNAQDAWNPKQDPRVLLQKISAIVGFCK